MRKSLKSLLMDVRYPALVLTASIDWGVSMKCARQRLTKGVADGYLTKYKKFYLPNIKLIDAYLGDE